MNEKPFLLTTAAQNIHVLFRKSLLHKKHFFELLKTAISSNACGTSTLKSPLLRAFSVPDVHPRLRKRPPRCTLDCGFETSESPALRGFVGGLRALATAALYLVLKSNGLRRPKIWLKKFDFSPKPIPTNIAKKLPPQRCSKSLFIPIFNFSHKRPTFAFASESGYTLGFRRRIAHNGSHGETGGLPSLGHSTVLSCQRNSFYSAMLLYTYISRFPVNPHYQQREKSGEIAAINFIPQPFLIAFSTSRTNGPRSLSRVKAGTHSALPTGSHTAAHTPKQGVFQMGCYYYPRTVSHVSETLRGQGVERQTLPLLGLGWMYFRRTQKACGTAMRLCASLFRGVAAPLGCVILVRMLIALLGGPVANFPALWYDKFNKLESVMH